MRAAALIALLTLGGPAVARAQVSPFRFTGHADFEAVAGEPVGPAGFFGGRLVGAGEYRPSERLTLFAELGARARGDAIDVTLDRVALRWAALDSLTFSAGRLHSPISYWTAAFAPGSWNRTSVTIPFLADPASGILPIHIVGVRADGRVGAGPLELLASAAFANGRDPALAGPGDSGDIDGSPAWSLSLAARPRRVPGLRVGGAFYGDRPLSFAGDAIDERIVSAHAAIERGPVEAVAEYVRIAHEDDADRYTSRGYYVQLAFPLPERYLALKPYLRVERLDLAEDDPLLASILPGEQAVAGGVRFDFLQEGALKAELRSDRVPGGADRGVSLHLAASFRVTRPDVRPPAPIAGAAGIPEPTTADSVGAEQTATKAASNDGIAAPARRPERSAPARPSAQTRAADGAAAGRPRSAGVAIVVHPSTPVSDISLPELRRIFRGEQATWPNDDPIVLLVRTPLPAEREVVLGRIYQMSDTELRQFWLGRIFRDPTATGPRVVSDTDTARRLLASLPGAISFLPADQVGPGMRVLRIDGKLPGEPGYPLQ